MTSDRVKTQFGLFFFYKTDSDLFGFLSSIFVMQIFDNFIMSQLLNYLYLDVAKDLIINSRSDFRTVYKTIGSWNNYSELNFGTNGRWFLQSKIVDEKIIYNWKWKKNLNTFVPNSKYNLEHFVPGIRPSHLSEYKVKVPRDSVSNKIDKKLLNEILISKKLINQEVLPVESEAWRITWENYRRYRTCRFWRHFPHHAEYVEKFFTDPKKRKK